MKATFFRGGTFINFFKNEIDEIFDHATEVAAMNINYMHNIPALQETLATATMHLRKLFQLNGIKNVLFIMA